MVRKLLIVLAALIVVLLGIIATRPATYRVERATRIAAPPDVVFGLVNDFHAWDRWSPWARLDPAMKVTYGGPPSGLGATYAWAGNSKVGEGNMKITESRPPQKVGIRLEFIKPMAAVNQTDFTFKPDGAGTRVSWAMSGTNNFVGKAFSLFADMDAMIGTDFEKGLSGMRSEAEAEAKERAGSASARAAAPATGTVPASGTAPAAPATGTVPASGTAPAAPDTTGK